MRGLEDYIFRSDYLSGHQCAIYTVTGKTDIKTIYPVTQCNVTPPNDNGPVSLPDESYVRKKNQMGVAVRYA